MRIMLVICLAALLLLASCRDLGQDHVTDSAQISAAGSAAPSEQIPSQMPSPSDDSAATAAVFDSITPPSQSDAPSPSIAAPTPTESNIPAASADNPAPSEKVNATLDAILKELSDLDKLYSQLDDVQDADLNE